MFRYEIISSINDLETYKDRWHSILESNENDNPFIEYEWISTWWLILGKDESVEIYVIYKDNNVIAFAPFIHTKNFGVDKFTFIGHGYATYMDIIAAEQWRQKIIDYLLQELMKTHKHVLFVLHGLVESRNTSRQLENFLIKNTIPHSLYRIVSPYINFEVETPDEFLKKHKNKLNKINRREKRLKSFGHVAYEDFTKPDLKPIFELFKSRWKKKVDTSGISDKRIQHFYEKLFLQKGNAFHVKIRTVTFEERVIGFTFDLCCRKRKLGYMIGHDPSYNCFGPGKLIEKDDILSTHNNNFTFFDLGSGYEPYKFEFYTDLDYSRKYIFSSKRLKERLFKRMIANRVKLESVLKSNRKVVEFKRNTLGGIRYFIVNATFKEKLHLLKNQIKNCYPMYSCDIYRLENKLSIRPSIYKEVYMKDILGHKRQDELIQRFYKGYRFFMKENTSGDIAFSRNDRFVIEDNLGQVIELPSNTTFINNYCFDDWENIVHELQNENLSIYTTVKRLSWKKKARLKKLGFQRVQRVSKFRLFKWEKFMRKIV